jgi:DNA-binding FadR family transcriptional regulator
MDAPKLEDRIDDLALRIGQAVGDIDAELFSAAVMAALYGVFMAMPNKRAAIRENVRRHGDLMDAVGDAVGDRATEIVREHLRQLEVCASAGEVKH